MASPQPAHELLWVTPTPSQSPAVSSKPHRPGRRTNWSVKLEGEHEKSCVGAIIYECPIESCGKRLSTSGNFNRHKRLHAVEKFACPTLDCSREYKSLERLEKHMRVHMGRNAYPCTVPGCTKAFSTSGNLGRHIRVHHVNGSTRSSRAPNQGAFQPILSSCTPQVATTSASAQPAGSVGDAAFTPFLTPPSDPLSLGEVLDFLICLFVDSSSLSED